MSARDTHPSADVRTGAAPEMQRHCCRICGDDASAPTWRVREMMFGSGEPFDYFQCAQCACLQIVDTPDDLGRHYGPGYYSYADRPSRQGLQALLVRARDRHLVGRVDPLGAVVARFRPYLAMAALGHLGLDRHARIVDVGSGGGELLLALQAIGFDRLLGVDPFVARDLDLGDGLRVARADLAAVGGEHDLVMFHHSLEHVAEPRRVLAAAASMLAPGGCCLVRVPTVSSWAWREYGADWCALDAPRHLFLHSVKSLRRLAGQAGLQVERIVSDSTAFQFWGSEQYRRGIALMTSGSLAIAPQPGAFTPAELRDFERRAAELNRQRDGDQIVVTLRRAA